MEALGREREPAELRALLWLLWQAMLLAKDIRDRERGGRAEIGVIEGDKEAASPGLMTVLQDTLGRRSMIKPAVSDEIMDQQQKSSIMLYQ
jgi:advillin